MITEVMPISRIREEFPSEWVLLEDPELSDAQEILGGRVLFHSKDLDEVYDRAFEFSPSRSALFFTGPLPKDTTYLL